MPKYNIDISDIYDDAIKIVESKRFDGIKRLVTNIYPDAAHFIYELLQNAEDAKATKVNIDVKSSGIMFEHNGTKQFDKNDVWGITSFDSTKGNDYISAGKFGIGFKSVYAFTDTPKIYCDSICFQIKEMLLPIVIDDLPWRKTGWTIFILPFNKSSLTREQAYSIISKRLEELEVSTLLFLRNIKKVSYRMKGGTIHSISSEYDPFTHKITIEKTDKDKSYLEKYNWILFSKNTSLHDKALHVDIAYPLRLKQKTDNLVFDVNGQMGDKVSITFYAQNESTNLKFHLNAPFGCTPSRDSVNKDDQDNVRLVYLLADLAKESISYIQKLGMLNSMFLKILPIKEDNVKSFYYPIVEQIHDAFRDNPYLKTVSGGYTNAKNAVIMHKNVYDKVFNEDDIKILFENKDKQVIIDKTDGSRAYKFLKELNVDEMTPNAIAIRMSSCQDEVIYNLLNKKSDEQLNCLYMHLYDGLNNLPLSFWRDFSKRKICRTNDGNFISPNVGYIKVDGIDIPAEYVTIAERTFSNSKAKEFLVELGATIFTKSILHEYRSRKEINEFLSQLSAPILNEDDAYWIACKILNFVKTHGIYGVDIKKRKFILGISSENDRKRICSPDECYIDEPVYPYPTNLHLVEKEIGKYKVSDLYTRKMSRDQLESWISIICELGAMTHLSVNQVDKGTEFKTGYDTDYEVAGLTDMLLMKNVDVSLMIWRDIGMEWDYRYATRKHQRNKNHSILKMQSNVLSSLKKYAWLPNKDGKFCIPANISEFDIDDRFLPFIDEKNEFRIQKRFLEDIEFGKNCAVSIDKAKKIEERNRVIRETFGIDDPSEVTQLKELYYAIHDSGLQIHEFIEYANSVKHQNQYKNTVEIRDKINATSMDKLQAMHSVSRRYIQPIESIIDESISIADELSADTKDTVMSYAPKRITNDNREEKEFMISQYSGYCQICGMRIVKKNGYPYFEAINLIDTDGLIDDYRKGMKVGWNTLCLCPNCAAKYKYSSRSMGTFFEDVRSITLVEDRTAEYSFKIILQGEECELFYTPRHLLALKVALEKYLEQKIPRID